MLAVTRMWNSVCAVAFMRRGIALARAYAAERRAFGQPLRELPLHADTLAMIEAETWGAFLMTFLLVELHGRRESGEIDTQQEALLRILTPLAKLATGKQCVSAVSEAIESFGGAGYVEDTGLPQLLRDAQVLPISLDLLLRSGFATGLAALLGRASAAARAATDPQLADAARKPIAALERAALWMDAGQDDEVMQAGARRLAMTLARSLQLALLCEHAQWMLDNERDPRGRAAALRYARLPVDLLHEVDLDLDRELLR
jgi:hypothetical protein